MVKKIRPPIYRPDVKLPPVDLIARKLAEDAASGTVPTSRTITAGVGLSGGGDLSADRTIDLEDTAVTPGSYTNTDLTVDAQGRITAAASGSAGGYGDEQAQDAVGTILTDTATIDFTYDDATPKITADVKAGSIGATELASTAVTPGSYTNTDLTVDADGRITAAANGSASGYSDEQVDDRVALLIQNGTGITWSYNDGANTLTPTVTVTQYTDEMVDDRVASLIQNGTGITWSYNDGANTLTPTVTITQYTDELAQDAVGGILTDSATIGFTYNDGANTITAIVIAGSIGATELASTAVTPGSYTNTNLTVDADGRITAASNGTAAYPAYDGAKVRKASALTGQNLTAGANIAWTTEDRDTNSYHDNVTNNDRVICPAGYCEIIGQLRLDNVTASNQVNMEIQRFNSSNVFQEVVCVVNSASPSTSPKLNASGVVNCAAGDYVVMVVLVGSDTSVDINTVSYLEVHKIGT